MLIKVIEEGCPICNGEVRGNYKSKYFCKKCNILYRYSQLKKPHKIKEIITDNNFILKRDSK